jgi:hypothetical protein
MRTPTDFPLLGQLRNDYAADMVLNAIERRRKAASPAESLRLYNPAKGAYIDHVIDVIQANATLDLLPRLAGKEVASILTTLRSPSMQWRHTGRENGRTYMSKSSARGRAVLDVRADRLPYKAQGLSLPVVVEPYYKGRQFGLVISGKNTGTAPSDTDNLGVWFDKHVLSENYVPAVMDQFPSRTTLWLSGSAVSAYALAAAMIHVAPKGGTTLLQSQRGILVVPAGVDVFYPGISGMLDIQKLSKHRWAFVAANPDELTRMWRSDDR